MLVSSYRPISLLSNINKIFEKLVYSRLYSFLTFHNCIYELQFGFHSKHSTNHALLSLTEMIREALDNSSFACGIFIDLERGNYRGLKLLGHVMKGIERVIEKIIRERISIDDMQFGFMPGRGTTDAIFIL